MPKVCWMSIDFVVVAVALEKRGAPGGLGGEVVVVEVNTYIFFTDEVYNLMACIK